LDGIYGINGIQEPQISPIFADWVSVDYICKFEDYSCKFKDYLCKICNPSVPSGLKLPLLKAGRIYFSKNHGGEKTALYHYQRLACLCRKFVIFGGRKNRKSLYEKELKIYGIFGNGKIVLSQFVLKFHGSQKRRVLDRIYRINKIYKDLF
jgi:hypothetical protein